MSTDKLKQSVCRSNSQRDSRALNLVKIKKEGKKICAVTLNHENKAALSSSAFLLENKVSYLLSLPGTDSQGFFSWMCPVKSVTVTHSTALYILRENFLEVGMGYSDEEVEIWDVPP